MGSNTSYAMSCGTDGVAVVFSSVVEDNNSPSAWIMIAPPSWSTMMLSIPDNAHTQ